MRALLSQARLAPFIWQFREIGEIVHEGREGQRSSFAALVLNSREDQRAIGVVLNHRATDERSSNSVFANASVHAVGPRVYSTAQVAEPLEPVLLQQFYGLDPARPHFAYGHDFLVGIQFVQPPGKLRERNEVSPNVGFLELIRIAHI